MPLIAFNVNLATDRLDVAQAIARAVRFSSGGLPSVKALGLRLDHRGIVQVSMNLTNYEQTPLAVAFARVAEEARRHGVSIADSEIIGLVPARALEGTTASELRLTRPPLLLPTA
jgi:glutamate formiminotransferase